MSNSYTAKTFIDAIPGTGGIISAIARKVGCTWNTTRAWIDSYPTVKIAYDNECETMLDLAESTVLKNIKAGDTQDAKWYLSKKGKRRGYGDQSVVELSGSVANVEMTVSEWQAHVEKQRRAAAETLADDGDE